MIIEIKEFFIIFGEKRVYFSYILKRMKYIKKVYINNVRHSLFFIITSFFLFWEVRTKSWMHVVLVKK